LVPVSCDGACAVAACVRNDILPAAAAPLVIIFRREIGIRGNLQDVQKSRLAQALGSNSKIPGFERHTVPADGEVSPVHLAVRRKHGLIKKRGML
jgi:hypothetical protein